MFEILVSDQSKQISKQNETISETESEIEKLWQNHPKRRSPQIQRAHIEYRTIQEPVVNNLMIHHHI